MDRGKHMGEINGFIMTLVAASGACALLEGFIPDGGMKKYVKYLISLTILIMLLSPLYKLAGMIPSAISGELVPDSAPASAKANSVVALHIEKALCEKFSIGEYDIEVSYSDRRITVYTEKKPWLIEGDILLYIQNSFNVEAEVIFYE